MLFNNKTNESKVMDKPQHHYSNLKKPTENSTQYMIPFR